jgi:cytochrome c556
VTAILSRTASTRVILAATFVSHGIVPMRVALMILLGLVIGVLGTVQVMNTLSARNPMPKAVMETMGYHMGELSHALKAKQCDAANIQHHLERLQSTATDIVPVFGIDEKSFSDKAGELQTHLQQAVQAAPADCAALAAAIKPIGGTCKSCHQQYR